MIARLARAPARGVSRLVKCAGVLGNRHLGSIPWRSSTIPHLLDDARPPVTIPLLPISSSEGGFPVQTCSAARTSFANRLIPLVQDEERYAAVSAVEAARTTSAIGTRADKPSREVRLSCEAVPCRVAPGLHSTTDIREKCSGPASVTPMRRRPSRVGRSSGAQS
jgi:hypothetical protein